MVSPPTRPCCCPCTCGSLKSAAGKEPRGDLRPRGDPDAVVTGCGLLHESARTVRCPCSRSLRPRDRSPARLTPRGWTDERAALEILRPSVRARRSPSLSGELEKIRTTASIADRLPKHS